CFKRKTAYEIETWLEFRRVLFRSVFLAGEAVSGYDETQQEARISAMLERVEGIEEASVMIVEEEGEAVSCIVVYRGEDSILSRKIGRTTRRGRMQTDAEVSGIHTD